MHISHCVYVRCMLSMIFSTTWHIDATCCEKIKRDVKKYLRDLTIGVIVDKDLSLNFELYMNMSESVIIQQMVWSCIQYKDKKLWYHFFNLLSDQHLTIDGNVVWLPSLKKKKEKNSMKMCNLSALLNQLLILITLSMNND